MINWDIYADECIPSEGTPIGCVNEADPLWESGYDITYSSRNYPRGEDYVARFVCNGSGEKCESFGFVPTGGGDYILP